MAIETQARVAELPEYPGYQITDEGDVLTSHNNRWGVTSSFRKMKPVSGSHGYLTVKLRGTLGISRTECVHILVLRAFVGDAKDGELCRHLDGNKKNNRLENLKWGTQKENLEDQLEHGTRIRGADRHNAKLTNADVCKIRELYASGVFQRVIADMYSIDQSNVSDIVNRRTWKHI